MKIGWIIFLVILACFLWMAFWGLLTNMILRRRGYKENWFWKGFLMPGFAAAKAMSLPEAERSAPTPVMPASELKPTGMAEKIYGQQPASPFQPAPRQQAYSDEPLSYDWGAVNKPLSDLAPVQPLPAAQSMQSAAAAQVFQPEPVMPAVQGLDATRKLYAEPAAAAPAQILSNGSWRCVCGRVNYSYIGTCACGRNKNGRNAEEEAMEKKQREKAEAEKKRLEQQKKEEQEKAAREAALKAEEERKAREEKKAREAQPQQQDISTMDEQAKLRMIREMKALLDEGIITQQEFDRKKKEYLGF